VETEDNRTAPAWPRANSAAEWVGYLCVAPLLAGLATVGLAGDYATRELAQRLTLAWGGVLLAFTGAVHWGLALAGRGHADGRLVGHVEGAVGPPVGHDRHDRRAGLAGEHGGACRERCPRAAGGPGGRRSDLPGARGHDDRF
jgi:hypothetical protein